MKDIPSGDLPVKLSKPAVRALHGAGCYTLQQVSRMSEAEVMQLHGIGKNAILQLRDALREKGLSFAAEKKR